MTFNKAALAIDGARTTSSLVRLGTYASTGGDEGVVAAGDLKVSPLAIAGNGFRIAAGGALILNDYQGTSPTQTYVVENIDDHIFGAESMPGVSGSDRYFIVAVVVGDQEYTNVGHPFMPSTKLPAGTEAEFEYVRPVLFPVASTAITSLGNKGYPLLELAQVRIKANSQTITADDILLDLRDLARPRSKVEQGIAIAPDVADSLGEVKPTYSRFPNVIPLTVKVPKWATTVKIVANIEGLRLDKAGAGELRAYMYSGSTVIGQGAPTNIDEFVPTRQKDRRSYSVAGKINIPDAWRGQTVNLAIQGAAVNTASRYFLLADKNSSVALTAFFEEALI